MAKEEIFTRTASGLVRHVSPSGALLFNMFNYSLGCAAWFVIADAVFVFPQGNFILAVSITAGLVLVSGCLAYIALSTAMPRSGGDYVYVSRILNPTIGFLANWLHVIAFFFWLGMWAGMIGTWSFPVALATIGASANIPSLIGLAESLANPLNSFIVGSVFIIGFSIIPMLGMRRYLRFQLIMGIIAISGFILTLILLRMVDHSFFIRRFNEFSKNFQAPPNYASAAIEIAKAEGGKIGLPFRNLPTAKIVLTAALGNLVWGFFNSSYIAGEIKKVERSQVIAIVGGMLAAAVSLILVMWVIMRTVGFELFQSLNYLFTIGSEGYVFPWTVPPYYSTFASLLTDNIVILCFIGVAMSIWAFMYIPTVYTVISRCLMAWSLDRVAPRSLGEVHPKYKVPIKGIIVAMIGGEISLLIYVYRAAFFKMIPAYSLENISFIFLGVAAMVFPYWKKDIFEASPLNQRIAGIPIVSISGLIFAVLSALRSYIYFFDPAYKFVWTLPVTAVFLLVILLGVVLFYAMRLYNKKKGIDVSLAFKEIPPE